MTCSFCDRRNVFITRLCSHYHICFDCEKRLENVTCKACDKPLYRTDDYKFIMCLIGLVLIMCGFFIYTAMTSKDTYESVKKNVTQLENYMYHLQCIYQGFHTHLGERLKEFETLKQVLKDLRK